ncbi:MAG: ACP S-malonyltransferase [Candidatus Omnitrophica bacterium]|nr:ACP S-malonyltransferase [Candidatus Omnitrophota bacterium]
MKLGFIFPGQGSQYVGMGKALYGTSPEARTIFDRADSLLGFLLTRTLFDGPEDELTRTDVCQPAIFVHSMAVLAGIQKEGRLCADVTAGLSLGEYAALCLAGVFSFEEGLGLVQARGRLMQEASERCPGGLVSLLGISVEAAQTLCARTGAVIANLNSPDQVVVAGDPPSLEQLVQLAPGSGVRRAIRLQVAGAFHSPLMDDAALGLEKELDRVTFRTPRIPVYSNLTGGLERDPVRIKSCLKDQVNHATRWVDCCQEMLKAGVRHFVEIGPGSVLRGLMRKIDPSATVISVEDPSQLKDSPLLKGVV